MTGHFEIKCLSVMKVQFCTLITSSILRTPGLVLLVLELYNTVVIILTIFFWCFSLTLPA